MITESNRKSNTHHYAKQSGWLLVLGILLIAANLRSPLTSVGPLVGSIHASLGISNTMAGSLTTIPLLAFAIFSTFAPKMARSFGMARVLFISLVVLAVGIVLRSLSGLMTLFAGTVLIGLAIAVCNVLLPGLIKKEFPQKVGIMTGSYSVSMNLCGAIASGISVPIARGLDMGWTGALGCWGILTAVSVLIWLPQLRFRHKNGSSAVQQQQEAASTSLWRSSLAWHVTLFMGLQSLLFYTIVSWFPEILQQRGYSPVSSGMMVSLMQFAILPVTFVVPILAARMKHQRLFAILSAGLFFLGIVGVMYGSPVLIPVWFILIGVAVGSSFSLAMMFFALRTQNTHQAAELSGMAQSVGYLLAAVGPILFGMLHDDTHQWTASLSMLVIGSILLLIFGLGAGGNRVVHANKITR